MAKYTVLDVETIMQWLESGKKDGSPFNPNNDLVSVGWYSFNSDTHEKLSEDYVYCAHVEGSDSDCRERVQSILDNTDLLIAHNAKFDLMWLHESGFTYSGPVFDTMAAEYISARGLHIELSLDACCKRHHTSLKKGELIEEYYKKHISFFNIPKEIVTEYGKQDIKSTYELYIKQLEILNLPANRGLWPTVNMHNEFLLVLEDTERAGIYVNLGALSSVERDYLLEKQQLVDSITSTVSLLMGDSPYSVSSPKQLSEVIYSRKVIDRKLWLDTFNIGTDERGKPLKRPRMTPKELKANINANTAILRRTTAHQCHSCGGSGRIHKLTRTGQTYKNLPKCKECDGCGILYVCSSKIAGLALGPRNINDLTANGFATDKATFEYLASLPNVSNQAKSLLTKLVRLNAVETYLSSFVGGIRRATRANKILHPTFNQCITATGRLSSSDPNFQNLPRGLTFPVKRCIRSRFRGGSILEADGMQLEFRTAAGLSKCPVMLQEIWDGVDVHAFTAKVLTDAGQPTSRQDAKSRTFRPLYGGQSGTPAEMAYNKSFMAKYTGLSDWHDYLLDTACSKHVIVSPSGREYRFPDASRNYYGYVKGSTQIKNYEVQGFATADYIPVCCIRLWRLFKQHNLKSLIINTVHDSVVCDIYPGEIKVVVSLIKEAFIGIKQELVDRYNYEFNVPVGVEIKCGHNWMNMKEIAVFDQVRGNC